MDLFWELYQESRIANAASLAGTANDRASAAEERVAQLQHRLEKLTLICMAMWSLAREQNGFDETVLPARVKELSEKLHLRDGHPVAAVVKCPKCGRTMSGSLGRCFFCGFVNEQHDPFEKV